MKFFWGKLSIIIAFTLMAAGCNSGPGTNITDIKVGLEITSDNRVNQELEVLPASAATIYLSGRINNTTDNSEVSVRWVQLPGTTLSTETFNGYRSNSNTFTFDNNFTTSYFASQIPRTGISWNQGEYRADVFLNGSHVGSRFFKIVSDSEAETQNNRARLSRVIFGNQLNAQNEVETSLTTFARNDAHIYTQVELSSSAPGTRVEASIRYLSSNLSVNTFTTTAGEDDTILFDLPLSRFGNLWNDGFWGAGGYEVEVKINGTAVEKLSFIVN